MSGHGNHPPLPRGEWPVWAAAALVILALKLAVAWQLPLLGDEAFYWWESRYPAWGYSELPPLTQWLIAATALTDMGTIGVRYAFLLLGTAVPLLVFRLAREFLSTGEALLAAIAALALPLVAVLGLLAVPDVLLNVLGVALALALVRAARAPGVGWWSLVGLLLALGLATHYRFAPIAAAAAAATLTVRDLRAQLSSPGPWLALAIGLCGLVPTLLFNLEHDFATARFQLVDRHPWSFQPEGLAQPLVQAMVSTPLLFLLLMAAAVTLVRRAAAVGGGWGVLAWLALLPTVVYFVVGLFADVERVGFHWPLPGYLPLCVAIPLLPWIKRHGLRRLALGIGLLASATALGGLWWLADHPDQRLATGEIYPDNALGWPVAAELARLAGTPEVIVSDNFMLGAELAFLLGRLRVYVLDHPLNARHGRAVQLAIWSLDQESLPARIDDGVLLVEETALDLAARPAWARHVCNLFPRAELYADRMLHGGRKRFRAFHLGRDGRCDHPAFAYLDAPARGARVASPFEVSGWAFDDDAGVAAVEVLLDDQVVAVADHGLPRPGVAEFFAGSTDPMHPNVGFRAMISAEPGPHRLGLRMHSVDGHQRDLRAMEIVVEQSE